MNKAEYPIVVHALSDEDGGGFLAHAPDLTGCMGDGASIGEAVSCLYQAMDEWFDETVRLERPVPAPFSQSKKFNSNDAALRKLVDVQAELIKHYEQALDKQNASLEELRNQVRLLGAGISVEGVFYHSGEAGSSLAGRCGGRWLQDTIMVASPERTALPFARKTLINH